MGTLSIECHCYTEPSHFWLSGDMLRRAYTHTHTHTHTHAHTHTLVRHYTCLSKKSRHSRFSPLKKRSIPTFLTSYFHHLSLQRSLKHDVFIFIQLTKYSSIWHFAVKILSYSSASCTFFNYKNKLSTFLFSQKIAYCFNYYALIILNRPY